MHLTCSKCRTIFGSTQYSKNSRFIDEIDPASLDGELKKKVDLEYQNNVCYPPYELILNAFKLTPFDKVKVVIMGQDPYHNPNQAMGLSFSVPNGEILPPSLKNIYKEIENEYGVKMVNNGDLTYLAQQGVLLLNAVLTVEEHLPTSHKDKGWETFTDNVIKLINTKKEPVVFILWGSYARNKKELITNPEHLIIESPHPSPFSARTGFFGSKPFSKTNEYLKSKGIKEVNWRVE